MAFDQCCLYSEKYRGIQEVGRPVSTLEELRKDLFTDLMFWREFSNAGSNCFVSEVLASA